MTKQEIKEKILVSLRDKYSSFEFSDEINLLGLKNLELFLSSALDTAYEEGRKQERERVLGKIRKEIGEKQWIDRHIGAASVYSEDIIDIITKLEKENE